MSAFIVDAIRKGIAKAKRLNNLPLLEDWVITANGLLDLARPEADDLLEPEAVLRLPTTHRKYFPAVQCVYFVVEAREVIYIGVTKSLRSRLGTEFCQHPVHSYLDDRIRRLGYCRTSKEAHLLFKEYRENLQAFWYAPSIKHRSVLFNLEWGLIQKYRPKVNIMGVSGRWNPKDLTQDNNTMLLEVSHG